MDEINVGKAALNSLSARFVNSTSLDARRELSIEQGRLQGETLSKRLALLYKVEECWPEIIGALARPGRQPMTDSYTEIMDAIRKKCPDCADKLVEQHRLLVRLNEAHALIEKAVLMIEGGAFTGSNMDGWVTLASVFTMGKKESPDWLKKAAS